MYHRLSVFEIRVPPLRELGTDRLALLEYFRLFYARDTEIAAFTLDAAAAALWMDYHFPGNVRELRNIVIRLTTKYPGQQVGVAQLEAELDSDTDMLPTDEVLLLNDSKALFELARKHLQTMANFHLDITLKEWEKSYVDAALALTHGNLSQAAKMLGINRTTLYSRMQNYRQECEIL